MTQSSGNHAQARHHETALHVRLPFLTLPGHCAGMQTLRQEGKAEGKQCIRMSHVSHGKAVVVMPEDSPTVKVSAVRDTYGAEALVSAFRVTMTALAVPCSALQLPRFGSASRRKKLERRCLQTLSGNFGRSMATRRRRKSIRTRRPMETGTMNEGV